MSVVLVPGTNDRDYWGRKRMHGGPPSTPCLGTRMVRPKREKQRPGTPIRKERTIESVCDRKINK